MTIFLLFSTAGKPLKTATTTASEPKAWHCRSSDFGKISLIVSCVKARGELRLLPDWELPGEPIEKKGDTQKEGKQKLSSLHFRISPYINIFKLQENSKTIKKYIPGFLCQIFKIKESKICSLTAAFSYQWVYSLGRSRNFQIKFQHCWCLWRSKSMYTIRSILNNKHLSTEILNSSNLPSDRVWQSPFERLFSPESIALRSDRLPATLDRAGLGELLFLFVAAKTCKNISE